MPFPRGSTLNGLHIYDELENPALERALRVVMRRLPAMNGGPVRLHRTRGLRDGRGAVHAGSFLRERRIAFDCTRAEFPRIFVHELFHFVWLRLGNPARVSWEAVLHAEWRRARRGELGWSAQWHKEALRGYDPGRRSRAWRLYCCESFCDTAAWLYSGLADHPEFTLAEKSRLARRQWFHVTIETRELSI